MNSMRDFSSASLPKNRTFEKREEEPQIEREEEHVEEEEKHTSTVQHLEHL